MAHDTPAGAEPPATVRASEGSSAGIDRVRALRDLVGYGRNTPPIEWPHGARVVLNVVMVYEEGSEYSVLWGDDRNDGWGEYAAAGPQPPLRDLGSETHFDYGSRAGIWRLARIIDDAGIPATVSATAAALALNPEVAAWMHERGHDLLGHGWRWTELWKLSKDEEREHLQLALKTYRDVHGSRPLGWNSRSAPSTSTRELLAEEGGFLYDSDASADDIPYYAQTSRGPFLVIPYTKTYNDSRYLISPGYSSPRDFLEILTFGLDELLRESGKRRTMMTVAMHVRWSGQAARASALHEFLNYALEQDGVLCMRREDIARWWHEHYPPPSPQATLGDLRRLRESSRRTL